MGRLSDHVSIRPLASRSVNLERDASTDDLAGYVPTARAIDTLRRVLEGLAAPVGTRAWSVTGPYGSGKSSFALVLDALCEPQGPRHEAAIELLSPVAPDVVKAADELIEPSSGLIGATTVAAIEPVTATVARALHRGALRRWPRKMPPVVTAALDRLGHRKSFPAIRQLVDAMCGYAPVVVVMDEFGKNLEYHAANDPGALFLMQELAELFSGAGGRRLGGIITLQHLAFDEYATALTVAARREWAKVQGRFEDVAFIDAPDQVVRLIADSIRHDPHTKAMAQRLSTWADAATTRASSLGLSDYLGGAEAAGRCYPLHPVTTAALPELCSRYGQYERTLVSFLASGEADSVVSFLAQMPDTDPLATVGLVEVYDYFVTAARTLNGAAAGSTRWLEVESRINDALVDDDDLDLLKVVGVLNLVSGNGPLRASAEMVAYAGDLSGAHFDEIRRRLGHLAERGVIAFRSFTDEFRLWNGTDFDVSGAIAESREMLSAVSPAQLLRDAAPAPPVIAGRHSQYTGILRFFDVLYANGKDDIALPPNAADGAVVYVVASEGTPTVSGDGRPVVFAYSDQIERPVAAAVELAAIRRVLHERAAELATDWVARRELQERAAQARVEVLTSLATAFDPGRLGVEWICAGERLTSRRGPSGALSDLCDVVFSDTPRVRNEMIARRVLTSQGAKARRLVIEAMLANEADALLDFDGYGPERAIYDAVLEEPGFHRQRSDGTFRFGSPHKNSGWVSAWQALLDLFKEAEVTTIGVDEIYARLTSRPFGLKAGVIPVLLTVALLQRRDDIAIYEEGTYQPRLSADLLERLMKNPDRYRIKNFAASSGARRDVIEQLGEALKIDVSPSDRRRNSGVLALMAPLLGTIRDLPAYTMATHDMSAEAVAVRNALLAAREPDEIIFRQLPVALGLPDPEAVAVGDKQAVDLYAEGLAEAVRELQQNFNSLLARVEEQLRGATGTPSSVSVRSDLATRAHRLVDRVLDRHLRAFLLTATEEGLDDADWLEAMALVAVEKPARNWRDADWAAFAAACTALGGNLKRLEALNYELLAQGSTEFTARRFTVTNPDGSEMSTVVVTDPAEDEAVESLVARVVAETSTLPAAIVPALVARLVETLLSPALSSDNDEVSPTGAAGGVAPMREVRCVRR